MLTGKYRFRVGFRKKLILQVQEEYLNIEMFGNDYIYRWRDAQLEDMDLLSIRLEKKDGI